MVTIIVRSSKDKSAVEYALLKFYGNDPAMQVETLGGARKCDDILKSVLDIVRDDDVYLLLLGRESEECAKTIAREAPPNLYVHVVPRKKVRNLRIEHLAWEIAKAKALIRSRISWLSQRSAYALFNSSSGHDLGIEPDPAIDTFFLISEGSKHLFKVSGVRCSLPLLSRGYGGEHDVYCGPKRVCRIKIPDEFAEISVEKLDEVCEQPSIESTLEVNAKIVDIVIERGARIMRAFSEGFNNIVVPLSGGKDSALCLYIATRVFEPHRIMAVYVDTGVEFPQTREYVEKLASNLGVNLVKIRAPIREEIIRRGEYPTHASRWCTEIKVSTLEKFVRSLKGRTLVVIGDRDAESRSRSWRPTVRDANGVRYVAPIKPWSTAHVQITLLKLGIGMNPLYELGFYRIGCYVCPSLRSWELGIIESRSDEFRDVLLDDLFKGFERAKRRGGTS